MSDARRTIAGSSEGKQERLQAWPLHGRSHRAAQKDLKVDAGSENPRQKPLIARSLAKMNTSRLLHCCMAVQHPFATGHPLPSTSEVAVCCSRALLRSSV